MPPTNVVTVQSYHQVKDVESQAFEAAAKAVPGFKSVHRGQHQYLRQAFNMLVNVQAANNVLHYTVAKLMMLCGFQLIAFDEHQVMQEVTEIFGELAVTDSICGSARNIIGANINACDIVSANTADNTGDNINADKNVDDNTPGNVGGIHASPLPTPQPPATRSTEGSSLLDFLTQMQAAIHQSQQSTGAGT